MRCTHYGCKEAKPDKVQAKINFLGRDREAKLVCYRGTQRLNGLVRAVRTQLL